MDWSGAKCLVLPDPFVKGMDREDDPVASLRIVGLAEALRMDWATDAHFVNYAIRQPDGAYFPRQARLNKPALSDIRRREFDVVASSLTFDFDLPGHARWNDELWSGMLEAWAAACAQRPILARTAAWYSTRSGWRAVYALPGPTPVDVAENMSRAMVALFSETALAAYVDRGVFDWTRLFRLPRVRREGEDTAQAPYYHLDVVADATPILSNELPADLQAIGQQYGRVVRVEREGRPGPEEAKAMLRTVNGKPTEWLKAAAARMRGREVYDYVNGTLKIERGGQRNNSLQKLVGSTVGLLIGVPGTAPDKVYALWIEAVEQMQARTGTDDGRDWLDILWEMVCRCWEKQAAQVVVKEAEEAQEEARAEKLSDVVLAGMRSWCKHPDLHSDDASGYEFVQRHAIACVGDRYHVLQPDGFYDPVSISQTLIPARLRELGMDAVVELTYDAEVKGEPVRKTTPMNMLLLKHATMVSSREGCVGGEGCRIRDVGTPAATLVFRMYGRRTDLFPEYDADVDSWLRAFAGEHYETLAGWIGHALNFEGGPICALSLNAPPGIGKKLLVEGLAECVDTRVVADAKEMTGRFQSAMLRSPFLVVNEGLPRVGRDASSDPADVFRTLVAGDTIHVEEKGKGIIAIHNPMRVLFTANNRDVLRSLYAHRDLSPSDRSALGRRLLHLDLTPAAADFLASRGGRDFTARPGRRWIRGDDGATSDEVVARHFLWLYKHRPDVVGTGRLLVEGDPDAWIVREMAVSSGGSAELVESLLKMLTAAEAVPGLMIEDGQVYVTAAGVRDFHVRLARSAGLTERMSLNRVGSVLHGLSAGGLEAAVRTFGGSRRLRWWHLDLDILAASAERTGIECPKLDDLLDERENRRSGSTYR